MKRRNYLMALFMLTIGTANASNFVTIKGENLMDANGKKLYIVGTNLGNWLNPEGYMFDFKKTNCEWMINDMVCELAGPDFAREFWQAFKDNYITEADIAYIKQTGANTIRLPFNYKLFTREDYMGKNDETEGFKQMDKVIDWCRKYDLHLILICTIALAVKRATTSTMVMDTHGSSRARLVSNFSARYGKR